MSGQVEYEILFVDGQVSQVAFDTAVRISLETPGRVDQLVAYAPLVLTRHSSPERSLAPRKLAADDLAAIHELLWSTVSRAVFFEDGSAAIESDTWRLRVETFGEVDAWSYEGPGGLTIHSSAGELSYNRPWEQLPGRPGSE